MEQGIIRRAGLNRLEDFIVQSKHGKKVGVQIHLRREKILRQGDACAQGREVVDGYLFIADFTFSLDNEAYTVSKVYSLSYLTPNADDLQVDRQVANARLKMDYVRLHKAGIEVEERYFQESECL